MAQQIAELIEQLPEHLQAEVRDFVEFLLHRYRLTTPPAKMKLGWAGGLREFRDKFTSVELQHQSLQWWDKEVTDVAEHTDVL
ncbi:MAG: DUF2281 domain-containing protein [Armatimonadota bacterium]|nr:DUF2281 domain-containing protein [Armatimonadota bacterium]